MLNIGGTQALIVELMIEAPRPGLACPCVLHAYGVLYSKGKREPGRLRSNEAYFRCGTEQANLELHCGQISFSTVFCLICEKLELTIDPSCSSL